MRIAVWNVRSGTDRKWGHIRQLDADVAVLCEVSRQPSGTAASLLTPEVSWAWEGTSDTKGVALAGFGLPIRRHTSRGAIGRWSVAGTVAGITVVGVWSCPARGAANHAGEVGRSIEAFAPLLGGPATVLAGDFNTAYGDGGFDTIVGALAAFGMTSTYHTFRDEGFGLERSPTFRARHPGERDRHIDYCFVSHDLMDRVRRVDIVDSPEGISDHAALLIDLDEQRLSQKVPDSASYRSVG